MGRGKGARVARDAAERFDRPVRVLFVCTGNSCRSQMAEGWARALKAGEVEAESAGTRPAGMNPLAVRAMREAGVDISGQRSKSVGEFDGRGFDVVATVCDAADGACPVVGGAAIRVHRSFDDPPKLAETARDEEEAMRHYRRVRDEIRAWVESMPGSILGA
ncbi:MAG: arsenate reductase ArsC [Phycisphaerales bacterium]